MATIVDGALKFDFMVSLQDLARAKIVSGLWMRPEILEEIGEVYAARDARDLSSAATHGMDDDFEDEWNRLEDAVTNNGWQLGLDTDIVKSKLDHIVQSFGSEIRHWLACAPGPFAAPLLDSIVWTGSGFIDHARTARNILARDDSGLDEDGMYVLACQFCLEDEIAVAISHVDIQGYLGTETLNSDPMAFYWAWAWAWAYRTPAAAGGDFHRPENLKQLVFGALTAYSKASGLYGVAVNFMWNILNGEEKSRNLLACYWHFNHAGYICPFLSSLDSEQQRELFRDMRDPDWDVILSHWLYGRYFLPTVLHALPVMVPECFRAILEIVRVEIRSNRQVQNAAYNDLCESSFRTIWREGRQELKEFVLRRDRKRKLQRLISSLCR